MESIKNFILPKETVEEDLGVEEKEKPKKKKRTAEYETVVVSGPDFVIRRKTAKTSKLLAIMMSAEQFYTKNELTGETLPLTMADYSAFVKDLETGTEIVDKDGNRPFWLKSLPVAIKGREAFMSLLTNRNFCRFACKNMASMPDNEDNWPRSVWCWCGHDASKPRPQYEQTYKILANLFGHDIVKESALGNTNGIPLRIKINSILNAFFEDRSAGYMSKEQCTSYTCYEYICSKWGLDGLRLFLKCLTDIPGSSIPDLYHMAELFGRHQKYRWENVVPTTFELRQFVEYVCYGAARQGFADNINSFLESWADYLNMSYFYYGEIKDKYPKSLLSEERILTYKMNQKKEKYSEKQFRRIHDEAQEYEHAGFIGGTKYIIVAPKTPSEMIDEGVQMSHCVATYVDAVAGGSCYIFFMRRAAAPDKSYVTIQVRINSDGTFSLGQVRAKFNRAVSPDVDEFVKKWFKTKFTNEEAVA